MKNPRVRYQYLTIVVLSMLAWISYVTNSDTPRFVRTSSAIQTQNASPIDLSRTAAGLTAFSPDGDLMASADSNGQINLWDVRSGQARFTLPSESANFGLSIVFSPDGNTLASVSGKLIQLWDVASGRARSILSDSVLVDRAVFSPEGRTLVSVGQDSRITLWDFESGSITQVLTGLQSAVNAIAISPDGEILAIGGRDAQIILWDMETGAELARLPVDGGTGVRDLVFSPDGKTLASLGQDSRITLWNPQTFSKFQVLADLQSGVNAIEFSPSSSILAAGAEDGQIKLWDLETGLELAGRTSEAGIGVADLVFSPDGNTLVSWGESETVFVWDLSNNLSQLLTGHSDWVVKAAFNSNRQTLASVDGTGQVILWDLITGLEQFSFQIPFFGAAGFGAQGIVSGNTNTATTPSIRANTAAELANGNGQTAQEAAVSRSTRIRNVRRGNHDWRGVTALAISPDGKLYGTATNEGDVSLWDSTGRMRFTIAGHHGRAVTGVVFSADGKRLVSVGRDTEVQTIDAANGNQGHTFLAHEHPIRSVAASPDGKFIASAGEETRIMLWDTQAGKLTKILSGHTDFVNSVSFSPDGKILASGGADSRILLWDVATGRLINTLLGHAGEVNTVAFSRDGSNLASGSTDSQVILWEVSAGRQLAVFAGHEAAVRSVGFHPNAPLLVSAGEDSKILVCNTATRRLVRQIGGAAGAINVVAFDALGNLLSGGEDGQITEWDVDRGRLKRSLRVPVRSKVENINSRAAVPALEPMPIGTNTKPDSTDLDSKNASKGLLTLVLSRILDWLIPQAEAALPGQGPGGPILIVNSSCPTCGLYNNYYAEILLAEGFNAFSVADISTVTATVLNAYDVVILGSTPLTAAQVTMFTDWVNGGGNLIASRPDPQLAGLLGLTSAGSTLSNGYLVVDTSNSPGNGIVDRAIQFHGTADRYTLNGASSLATLYSDRSTATTNPALTLKSAGSGQAAAFTYDFATSIVYTRQGNPAWEAQERDGFAPIRSDDKFFGDAAADPQPDWVDLQANVDIPQADEQQRLLANLITQMNLPKKPLPRFWYFPRGKKAVVIMTGDDHGNGGTAGRFNQFNALSPAGCSVPDWECVRGTSYIYPNTPMTDGQVTAYTAAGFEVGLHINTGCSNFTPVTLENFYAQQIAEWQTRYPSIPAPITQRHHCIAWSDWTTAAQVQLNHGIRLDTSYYFWPPGWVNNKPGFFTGSAMPMRFAALDGSLIDVYEAVSHMTDESGQSYPFTVDTLLDRALGPEGYYGAYTINAHTDLPQIPEATEVVNSALARNVPVVSSVQMLNWLDARNASSFQNLAWNGTSLSFDVVGGAGAIGLQAMVPAISGTGVLVNITKSGSPVSFSIDNIKGTEYALFPATTGTYVATFGDDPTPPTVTSTFPVNGAANLVQQPTVTATFSEAIDPATINGSTFQLQSGGNPPIAANVSYDASARTAKLKPNSVLTGSTTYTATLTTGVKDLAGNALAAPYTWSFTTQSGSACPCSAWNSPVNPGNPSANDPNGIEVGVKFRSDLNGFIWGIRFYQANAGTFTANLWDTAGDLLSTGNVTTTTAGWHQVNFATPIAIAANAVYVASYHAPNGQYAADNFFFGISGVDNYPIHLLQDGVSGGNGVYAYGASSVFPTNTFQSTNYWVDVSFSLSATPDTTPPTVTGQSPSQNATNVFTTASVKATFSEPMDQASINSSTFELRDPGNNLVSAAITYDSGTQTATFTPANPLTPNTTYTARIKGGATAPQVKDRSGNALASDYSWAFTTIAGGPNCTTGTSSVWPGNPTPSIISDSDTNSVELGVKFRSSLDGYICGIRFYKGAANTGTHIGKLWSNSGQLIASATFQNETASGWQRVDFANPVAITANVAYEASYLAPVGRYSANSNFFTAGVPSGPLYAFSSAESGGNGVYLYGSGGFPSNTYQSSNYWVDVVFAETPGPDTTPPTVTGQSPNPNSNGVSTAADVTASFSEPMNAATINSSTIELRNPANNLVSATIAYNSGTKTATLTPANLLTANTTYSAKIKGGTTDPRIKDAAGNALAADLNWSFTTAAGIPNCSAATSIWPTNPTPSRVDEDPTAINQGVELGVKFRSTVNGFVCGIRFYKDSQNIGTHVGTLWTGTGQQLAQATFSNETASGWQQVNFASPVWITANTTYMVSYHAPVGRYSVNSNYFTTGFTSGQLYAFSSTESNGNGTYLYGSGGFPTNTYQSENYWVDVLFTAESGPDTTPPTVAAATPVNGATGFNPANPVTATFTEAMNPATINSSTFELRDPGNNLVSANVTYDSGTNSGTLTPANLLAENTTYSVTIKGGATDPRVKDVAGDAMAANFTSSFTTGVDPCSPGGNPIVCENEKPGNPSSEWDVSGVGDPSIQGFATQISVNRGETVRFKIGTTSTDYVLDIYRMGYYAANGARKVASVQPSATLPQSQPACLTNATGLIDCGNWAESASWPVPPDAVSGIYFAKAIREDGADAGKANHIVFVVRDDASTSDLLFQTSDTTWQAYNEYGGNSLYTGSPAGRAFKVSYNRPFNTRAVDNGRDWLFNAEYPMVRWLEANGFDVSYFTGVDTDQRGNLITNHKVFLSVGHDEYWSGTQRANVEAAQDLGVHLAFFSGNEVFWKTRWENSIDGSGTAYRTLVCYKETHENAKIDPLPDVWTGTWRDPRFSPPADGGRPENELSGTIFMVNAGATTSIEVPAADGKMRFWRNTNIANLAPGTTAILPHGTMGYEWDEDLDNGFRPAGLVRLSTTTVNNAPILTDYGSTFGSGTATHSLTMYRAGSGAIVFGSGTVQWSWGLDGNHDNSGTPADPALMQATVNLFADMGVQPENLQAGLQVATPSTDATRPASTISSPAGGTAVPPGSLVTISGTASDTGGSLVGGVEVSVDGGLTWHPAVGRSSWTYGWNTPNTNTTVTIKTRAVDDSLNLEIPGPGVTVNVGSGS